jgi:hypothetical protein
MTSVTKYFLTIEVIKYLHQAKAARPHRLESFLRKGIQAQRAYFALAPPSES